MSASESRLHRRCRGRRPRRRARTPGLTITKLAVSDMANNAYLLRDTATGEALLIDAAADPEALRGLIGDSDLRTVVTTHGHWDHHRALPDVVSATGAETVAHAADAGDLPVPVTRTVGHGDTVTFGGQTLEVIHLRGHTPGSIALVWRGPATPACTCSPATACSPAASATPRRTPPGSPA